MKNDKSTKHQTKLGIFSVIVIVLLFCANLVVSNSLATTGVELKKLHGRKSNLLEQNNYIKNQVLHFKSLALVETKAIKSGFQKFDKIVSLTQEEPVAMNQP